jgi:hypothetical protein
MIDICVFLGKKGEGFPDMQIITARKKKSFPLLLAVLARLRLRSGLDREAGKTQFLRQFRSVGN